MGLAKVFEAFGNLCSVSAYLVGQCLSEKFYYTLEFNLNWSVGKENFKAKTAMLFVPAVSY